MGQQIVITIEGLTAGGSGLARLEGQVVFIAGVLPGETVRAELIDRRSGYLRARAVAIIEAHPDRRIPPCPHFLDCGGCQLLHLVYPAQPVLKTEAILSNLKPDHTHPAQVHPAPHALFYRDRVRLHLGLIQGRATPGFFAAGSRRLIPVSFCYQLHPRLNRILPLLAEWAGNLPLSEGTGIQLEVLVGAPGEGFEVVVNLPGRPSSRMKGLLSADIERPARLRIHQAVKGRMTERWNPEHALSFLSLPEHALNLKAGPGVFTQVNPTVNRMMVRQVLTLARTYRPKRVLDLFCGLGNFTLPLAGIAAQVVGVEDNPAAVANARYNLTLNRISNVTFIRKAVAKIVPDLVRSGERFDLVVLDPPRSGAPGLAPLLARLKPQAIIYVSCHPAALNRDLAEFTSLGFSLQELTALDMFPQTAHIELLACLTM